MHGRVLGKSCSRSVRLKKETSLKIVFTLHPPTIPGHESGLLETSMLTAGEEKRQKQCTAGACFDCAARDEQNGHFQHNMLEMGVKEDASEQNPPGGWNQSQSRQ